MYNFKFVILFQSKPMFIVKEHERYDIQLFLEGYLTGLGKDWTYDDYEMIQHIDLPTLSFTIG